ncbi:conserved protein of unknown function [Cupriavidus taiwanensis]|uniref:Uncharacterized protein n=1 Tax=Cupriavidus taiwanensis TaxID=164546 RepID=A0A375IDG5_9BURK|nr:conserved hypothetical protein [Cupriavidus taiwanensis]SOY79418.1 conserved hypothetical protein [Cupriavidus taiwanensis]SOZ26291.1 conserved hypothetical protein [Cupriavidus taiwanensis]SOZ76591.1 conserved hypothetical protein [Cupriavidus taiwanensis]SOZ85363.1 conserved hypothetical protein [Cupriavidus taiwanensis]
MARERFNRESACRGIGENPRIKPRAALPIARAWPGGKRQSKKPEARLPAFLNSLVGRE